MSIEDESIAGNSTSDELCRLCANTDKQLIPIFNGEGIEHDIPGQIRKYLPIISVTELDELPLQICYQCTSTLIAWHNFFEQCRLADSKLKEISISSDKFTEDDEPYQDGAVDIHDDSEDQPYVRDKIEIEDEPSLPVVNDSQKMEISDTEPVIVIKGKSKPEADSSTEKRYVRTDARNRSKSDRNLFIQLKGEQFSQNVPFSGKIMSNSDRSAAAFDTCTYDGPRIFSVESKATTSVQNNERWKFSKSIKDCNNQPPKLLPKKNNGHLGKPIPVKSDHLKSLDKTNDPQICKLYDANNLKPEVVTNGQNEVVKKSDFDSVHVILSDDERCSKTKISFKNNRSDCIGTLFTTKKKKSANVVKNDVKNLKTPKSIVALKSAIKFPSLSLTANQKSALKQQASAILKMSAVQTSKKINQIYSSFLVKDSKSKENFVAIPTNDDPWLRNKKLILANDLYSKDDVVARKLDPASRTVSVNSSNSTSTLSSSRGEYGTPVRTAASVDERLPGAVSPKEVVSLSESCNIASSIIGRIEWLLEQNNQILIDIGCEKIDDNGSSSSSSSVRGTLPVGGHALFYCLCDQWFSDFEVYESHVKSKSCVSHKPAVVPAATRIDGSGPVTIANGGGIDASTVAGTEVTSPIIINPSCVGDDDNSSSPVECGPPAEEKGEEDCLPTVPGGDGLVDDSGVDDATAADDDVANVDVEYVDDGQPIEEVSADEDEELDPARIKSRCSICSSGFRSLYAAKMHEITKHFNGVSVDDRMAEFDAEKFKCTSTTITRTSNNGNGSGTCVLYKCDRCKFVCDDGRFMMEHYPKHVSKKPYSCDTCFDSFQLKSSAGRHVLRKHLRIGKYDCDFCGRNFREKRIMQDHRNTHTGDRPYVCDKCGESFAHLDTLSTHKNYHNGFRRYECPHCSRRFSRSNHLSRHLYVHDSSRPRFVCKLCHEPFDKRELWARHTKKHKILGACTCYYCGKEFPAKPNLIRHIRRVHFKQTKKTSKKKKATT